MSDHGDARPSGTLVDMPWWASGTKIPRISVRALVLDGDDVIAIENLIAPGMLHMPGGGIEHGETMLDALGRELHEELSAAPASAEYLLAIENLFDTPPGLYHCVEHVFLVTLDSAPQAGEDGLAVHRLPLAAIGTATFYPTEFRDLLTQEDWRAHRFLKAGKFAGQD